MANANNMYVKNGGGVWARQGRQWGVLKAKTYEDGRALHTSMHQMAGRLKFNKDYKLSMTIKSDGAEAYHVGLFAGTLADGPLYPLKTLEEKFKNKKTEKIEVTYHLPDFPVYKDMLLFVRLASVPNENPGESRFLFDDIELAVK